VKVCDKTCIFCFFPVVNKYLCMAKRSLLSERPLYICMYVSLSVYWVIFAYVAIGIGLYCVLVLMKLVKM